MRHQRQLLVLSNSRGCWRVFQRNKGEQEEEEEGLEEEEATWAAADELATLLNTVVAEGGHAAVEAAGLCRQLLAAWLASGQQLQQEMVEAVVHAAQVVAVRPGAALLLASEMVTEVAPQQVCASWGCAPARHWVRAASRVTGSEQPCGAGCRYTSNRLRPMALEV
jgi:hypothetical protein